MTLETKDPNHPKQAKERAALPNDEQPAELTIGDKQPSLSAEER